MPSWNTSSRGVPYGPGNKATAPGRRCAPAGRSGARVRPRTQRIRVLVRPAAREWLLRLPRQQHLRGHGPPRRGASRAPERRARRHYRRSGGIEPAGPPRHGPGQHRGHQHYVKDAWTLWRIQHPVHRHTAQAGSAPLAAGRVSFMRSPIRFLARGRLRKRPGDRHIFEREMHFWVVHNSHKPSPACD